jgi:beta-mannosidase
MCQPLHLSSVKFVCFSFVIAFCFVFGVHSSSIGQAEPVVLDLDGGPDVWKVVNSNKSISVGATVPGNIWTDLMRAGVIGDPYWRYNDIVYRWVGKEQWTYSRLFTLDTSWLAQKRILLVAEGIDTVATILINGQAIAWVNNMFRKYAWDVTTVVKSGTNVLTVAFQDAVSYVNQQKAAYPYNLPSADDSVQNGELNRNFVRKEQCSFSWDWGPCFNPQGIWQPIRLVAYSTAVLDNIAVQVTPHSSNTTNAFRVEVDAQIDAVVSVSGTLTLSVANTHTTPVSRKVLVTPGVSHFTLTLDVANVALWWPAGYGTPNLYNLTVSWTNDATQQTSTITKRIGFRTVEIITKPYPDQEGLSFYYQINGVPTFIKGANFVPLDSFESRVTPDVIRRVLMSTVEANMNLVRVWGGGIYQWDLFYDLCDEWGVMVWQEFMFACAMYPRDEPFLANVRAEVRDQVRRLMHHPSIVTWSANNENEAALTWFVDTLLHRDVYVVDYVKLYIDTILTELWAHDRSRPFLPSSPSQGALVQHPFYAMRWGLPGSNFYGDVHYYNYDADCTDMTKYPTGRFISEYGYQSFPSLLSWRAVSDPNLGDWKIDGSLINARQHHRNGTAQVKAQIRMHFLWREKSDPVKNFGDFVYLSQVTQALCIKSETEFYRRNRNQKPNTMGAIYWQLNDIWQAPTWSSTEYGGRWKMLHYFARQFFSPVLVSSVESPKNTFVLWIVSDLQTPVTGVVKMTLWSWIGQKVNEWNVPFTVPPLTSAPIFHTQVDTLLSGKRREQVVLALECYDTDNRLLSKNVFYFTSLSKTQLPQVNWKFANWHQTSDTTATFTLSASVPAAYVWLETPLAGRFSDNGFLYLPSAPLSLTFYSWTAPLNITQLQQTLTITSISDTY